MQSFLNSLRDSTPNSITQKVLIRVLVVLVVVLALLAGYYHASLESQTKKYLRLEDMYVRVRGQLGREETQRLIDLSRAQDKLKAGDSYDK